QERIAHPGKSMAAENCRAGSCTPNSQSESKYTRDFYSLTHEGRYGAWQSNSYIQQEETKNPVRQMKVKNLELNSQWKLSLDNHHLTLGAKYTKVKIVDNIHKCTRL